MMRPLVENPWFGPVVAPLVVGALLVALWQFGCRAFQVPVYLFPAPSDIATSLTDNWADLLLRLAAR